MRGEFFSDQNQNGSDRSNINHYRLVTYFMFPIFSCCFITILENNQTLPSPSYHQIWILIDHCMRVRTGLPPSLNCPFTLSTSVLLISPPACVLVLKPDTYSTV